MTSRHLVALMVVASCGHHGGAKVSPLGYASPAQIAQWVGACAVPLAQHPNLLGIDLSCDERQGEDPSWRISILYKDDSILSVTMSERSVMSLGVSIGNRLDRLVDPAVAKTLGSADGPQNETLGSGIDVARTNIAGNQVITPAASVRWLIPATAPKR